MRSRRYDGDPKAGTSTPKSETIVVGVQPWRGIAWTLEPVTERRMPLCSFFFLSSCHASRGLTAIGSAGWSITVCPASQPVQYGRLGHFFYILGENI